jgi:orotate phosphoribosyltransferase
MEGQALEEAMEAIKENGYQVMEYTTSCFNHLNGKRQSKKMGPPTIRIHGLID